MNSRIIRGADHRRPGRPQTRHRTRRTPRTALQRLPVSSAGRTRCHHGRRPRPSTRRRGLLHRWRRVLLILQDGRVIVGVMVGFDQRSNVVLSDSKERVYSMDAGVEEMPLGLYLVKGDMMCVPHYRCSPHNLRVVTRKANANCCGNDLLHSSP
ncbi:hypothetical protein C8F04DRAFT_950148 [Mycena alexandri]|uniref:LSM2-LSM8 complex subunit LSM8 n=1 Tax=Mycena alexandri TaxID=1745969 RepID=A0AAD6SDB6_9AGAR|nr:hypothetical protein C8F04DRAFT_968384 [Mycena alexandri]KAJ7039278.1 hypothetical protein C8F04DRAFT_950148 [Mycena alexandri]